MPIGIGVDFWLKASSSELVSEGHALGMGKMPVGADVERREH